MRQSSQSSGKRPHSPDIVSALDRPSKRPSLVTGNLGRCVMGRCQISSANSSRHPSEDWVRQAGGLTIDSPILSHSNSYIPNPDGNVYEEIQDTDMAVEPEANGAQPQASYSNEDSNSNDSDHRMFQSDVSSSRHQAPSPSVRPAINVVPPTPISTLPQSSLPVQRPSTPPMNIPEPMILSPTSSFSQICSPRTHRPRFSMGPRADCEKCRLKAKGHSVHWD